MTSLPFGTDDSRNFKKKTMRIPTSPAPTPKETFAMGSSTLQGKPEKPEARKQGALTAKVAVVAMMIDAASVTARCDYNGSRPRRTVMMCLLFCDYRYESPFEYHHKMIIVDDDEETLDVTCISIYE